MQFSIGILCIGTYIRPREFTAGMTAPSTRDTATGLHVIPSVSACLHTADAWNHCGNTSACDKDSTCMTTDFNGKIANNYYSRVRKRQN